MPFIKGQSGNPGGRPKGGGDIRSLAQKHSKEALAKLVELMRGDDVRVSAAAAQYLLDRAWGRPAQSVTGEGGEGPVKSLVEVRWIGDEP